MLVSEMKAQWENDLIAQSPLWNRHIENLKPLDLTAFLRLHWGTPLHSKAVRQVGLLIDLGWFATIDRKLPQAPAITFFDPTQRERITVDELCAWLGEVSVVRRRAILFALETGMPIPDLINLTWKQLHGMKDVSDYAMTMANLNPRHIKLDYVFWEPMVNLAAAPLFGLAESMMTVSQGMGYDALKRLYREAIPFDTKADLEEFTKDFCTEFDHLISTAN